MRSGLAPLLRVNELSDVLLRRRTAKWMPVLSFALPVVTAGILAAFAVVWDWSSRDSAFVLGPVAVSGICFGSALGDSERRLLIGLATVPRGAAECVRANLRIEQLSHACMNSGLICVFAVVATLRSGPWGLVPCVIAAPLFALAGWFAPVPSCAATYRGVGIAFASLGCQMAGIVAVILLCLVPRWPVWPLAILMAAGAAWMLRILAGSALASLDDAVAAWLEGELESPERKGFPSHR